MSYLLDTNACIRVLNGTSERLVARIAARPPTEFRLSAVTRAELRYGARRSARTAANIRKLTRFFEPFASLPFDDRAAEHYAIVRADLASRGEPIGPNDLLIAATALAHDLTVVTHNVREFDRVVGLRVEDWED